MIDYDHLADRLTEAGHDLGAVERALTALVIETPSWGYGDSGTRFAVYQQPGRLDWDRLPAGEVAAIGDADVWFRPGNPVVAVTQRGDLVVTVVSAERAAVLTAVAGMPAWRRRAVWDRLHDASQRLVQVFALEG